MKRTVLIVVTIVALLMGFTSMASGHLDLLWDDRMGKSGETAPVTFDSPLGGATTARVNDGWNNPRPYGEHQHYGVDLNIGSGTQLKASYNGWVSGMDTDPTGCEGQRLWIRYDVNNDSVPNDMTFIRYIHLSAVKVNAGAYVVKGQYIADSGATGTCLTGAHLHFDVQREEGTLRRHISPYPWFRNLNITWARQMALNKNMVKYGDRLYVDISATDDGNQIAFKNVVLWWRYRGTTTWYSFPMQLVSGDTWVANARGPIPSGNTVEYVIQAERSDMLATDYRWAWIQPQYRRPDQNPNKWEPDHPYSQVDTWTVSY